MLKNESESDGDGGDRSKHHPLLKFRHYDHTKHHKEIMKLHYIIFEYSKEKLPTLKEFKKMSGYICVSEDFNNTTIVGYILYTDPNTRSHPIFELNSNYNLKNCLYVDYVGVDPNYQGKGIGKSLMSLFISYLNEHSYICLLDVENDTQHTKFLVNWYGSNGFEILFDHYEEGVHFISMIRMNTNKLIKTIHCHEMNVNVPLLKIC